MRLGAHQSIARGLDGAVGAAAADGCEALQIFTRNQAQWRVPPLVEEAQTRFRAALAAWRIPRESVLVHASYLINLATADAELGRRSTEALIEELRRCRALGLPYLVLHPGAHMGQGEGAGVRLAARRLGEALAATDDGVEAPWVLLENTAGQGTCIGHRFEHLRDLIGLLGGSTRLGVCLDTQHAFAAGHDLASAEGLEATLADAERTFGLTRLHAFHLNDSKRERGARVDRHELPGRGHIGKECFRRLLADRRFAALPGVMELPPPCAPDLARLRRLADGEVTAKRRPPPAQRP